MLEKLAMQGTIDDVRRELEVANENVTMKASRGERPEERSAERAVVETVVATQDFREGRGRRIDVHGGDQSTRKVNAVRATRSFDQFQGAGGRGTVQRSQQVPQGG